jgi:hypothetical protein
VTRASGPAIEHNEAAESVSATKLREVMFPQKKCGGPLLDTGNTDFLKARRRLAQIDESIARYCDTVSVPRTISGNIDDEVRRESTAVRWPSRWIELGCFETKPCRHFGQKAGSGGPVFATCNGNRFRRIEEKLYFALADPRT